MSVGKMTDDHLLNRSLGRYLFWQEKVQLDLREFAVRDYINDNAIRMQHTIFFWAREFQCP